MVDMVERAEDHKTHFQKESARNRCSTAIKFLIASDAWEMRYELNFVGTLGKKIFLSFFPILYGQSVWMR